MQAYKVSHTIHLLTLFTTITVAVCTMHVPSLLITWHPPSSWPEDSIHQHSRASQVSNQASWSCERFCPFSLRGRLPFSCFPTSADEYKKPGNWLIPSTHSLAHHSGGRLIVPKRDHRIYSQSWDLCWDSALFNFLWAYYIAKLSSHLDSINPRTTSLLIPCLAALDWSIESMSSRRFAFRSHY